MRRSVVRLVALAAVSALTAVACSSGGSGSSTPTSSAAAQGGTYSVYGCEPQTLIFPKDYESCGSQVFEGIYTQLVTYSPSGQWIPDQAVSVTSPDQKVWTIKIKPGWHFDNGEPVTAQSYANSWNYTALGSNAAILNYFFARFQGYAAMNPAKGKAKVTTLSGVKVLDSTTLQVTLTAPFSQFPVQLGFYAFDPLPQAFFKNPKAFNEQPIGDGPYMMDGPWKHNEMIKLKKNPQYGGTPGYADEIDMPIYTGDSDFADFEAGNLDVDLVGSAHLQQAEQNYPSQLEKLPSSDMLYFDFPLWLKQFQNPHLRIALSLDMNRPAIMKAILVNEVPADDFVAPLLAGYRKGACTYCVYNPTEAKQQLADAGGWKGTMTIWYASGDPVSEQAMEAVANGWRQDLGIQVKLNPVDPNTIYDDQVNHKYNGPLWDGWVMDYPSMEDYLSPIYGTNGSYNTSGYTNPSFDALVAKGDAAPSMDASITQYQQADNILLKQMPGIPWGYVGLNFIHSTRVTNVVKQGNILDSIALEKVQVVNP